MVFVCNDLHGNSALVKNTVDFINENLEGGDILVINGDGSGARGPRMNELVRVFYDVRRLDGTELKELFSIIAEIIGEWPDIPQEWVYDSIHAGVFRKLLSDRYEKFKAVADEEVKAVIEGTLKPLSEAAKSKGADIVYLSGNGEMVPNDFSTEDITIEKALPPEERYYHRLYERGFFDELGIKYVPFVLYGPEDTLFISSNLLDLEPEEALEKIEEEIAQKAPAMDGVVKQIISHYPLDVESFQSELKFWNPNKADRKRIENLKSITRSLLEAGVAIREITMVCGHIHYGITDPRMVSLPQTITLRVKIKNRWSWQFLPCTWVKPGAIISI